MLHYIKHILSKNPHSAIQHMPLPLGYIKKNILTESNALFNQIFNITKLTNPSFKTLLKNGLSQSYCPDNFDTLLQKKEPLIFEGCCTKNQWYQIVIHPDPHNIQAHYVTAHDISQFKRRDELLSLSSKMESLGQLAGGVAHDFNNILSIAEGYASLIEKDEQATNDTSLYAGRIRKVIERGGGITRQLLTFGQHKIIGEAAVTLGPFFDEIKTLLYPLLGAQIHLSISIANPDMAIKASKEQLTQIIFNAVRNAKDALEAKINEELAGKIGIMAMTREDGIIEITVHDNGMGMDSKTQKRAFEPFFTTKDTGQGTGLGLSQIYGIMQQLGGDVEISSQTGQGTSLKLSFLEADPDTLKDDLILETKDALIGKTILIVDDEPDILFVLQKTLESHDFTILTANGANEALAIQDDYDGAIDWLLSDVVMPDMTGTKLAELFKAERPDTHVIFMSGYPASGDMARVELPENSVFLAKPLNAEKLMKIFASYEQGQSDDKSANLEIMAGKWQTSHQKEGESV